MAKLKMGVFGLWRGSVHMNVINEMEEVELWAICDKDEKRLANAAAQCPPSTLAFTNFDDFIESGVEAVILANYFNEHAKYAIRCLNKGIHVYTECTAAPTLKECVELCEAVEKSGCKFMQGENYAYTRNMLEFKNVVEEGTLGRILYAEGEYNHTGSTEELLRLTPGEYHWRAWMPRTYYLSHSMGPLLMATGQLPVSVSAIAVHSEELEKIADKRHNDDAFAMIHCKTDGGALFRFTGCAHMGSPSGGFRIAGEYGAVETGRGVKDIRVTYHSWTIPEGRKDVMEYRSQWPSHAEQADKAGHGGGDFWTVYHFVQYIVNDVEPFFNVYHACAMSATAILAWRSILQNGRTYKVPDFRNAEERAKYRHDDLTPFPNPDGSGITLPCGTADAEKNWKDLVLPDYE